MILPDVCRALYNVFPIHVNAPSPGIILKSIPTFPSYDQQVLMIPRHISKPTAELQQMLTHHVHRSILLNGQNV